MRWLVAEGDEIAVGNEIVEIETEKIASALEATDGGLLRRLVAEEGDLLPVKALLGVLVEGEVSDEEIDAFVAGFVVPEDEDEDEEEEGIAYQYAETAAGRLRYTVQGEGAETVLLVHGFGGDLDNWLFNLDALAAESTVVALDLPGHGPSPAPIPDPSVPGLATAVLDFMDCGRGGGGPSRRPLPRWRGLARDRGGRPRPGPLRHPRLPGRPRPGHQPRVHRRLRLLGLAPAVEARPREPLRGPRARQPLARGRGASLQAPRRGDGVAHRARGRGVPGRRAELGGARHGRERSKPPSSSSGARRTASSPPPMPRPRPAQPSRSSTAPATWSRWRPPPASTPSSPPTSRPHPTDAGSGGQGSPATAQNYSIMGRMTIS